MKKIFFLTIAIALFFQSCMKELGNYEYTDVNKIVIDSIKTFYTIEQYTIPNITPVISQTIEKDESNLSFYWTLETSAGLDTLCKNKIFDSELYIPPGDYYSVLFVFDNKTGLYSKVRFSIRVVSAIGEGLMVLSKKTGSNEAALTYFSTSNKVIKYPSFIGTDPVNIYYVRKGASTVPLVHVMCKDNLGGIVINPTTLTKFYNFKDFFYIPNTVVNPQSYTNVWTQYKTLPSVYGSSYYSANFAEYVCNDNKVHIRYAYGANQRMDAPFLAPDDLGYFASPFIIGTYNGPSVFIYDEKNSRFLEATSISSNRLTKVKIKTTTPRVPFDPHSMGMKLKVLHADWGLSVGSNMRIYYIMKDTDNNKNYYVEVLTTNLNFAPSKIYELNIPIDSKTKFGCSVITPAFYYSDKNKIYSFDVEVKSSVLRETLPDNEEITSMFVEHHVQKDPITNKDYYDHLRLYVGVKGAVVNGNDGSIYIYKINNDNTLTLLESKKNFSGEIVSFAWKR